MEGEREVGSWSVCAKAKTCLGSRRKIEKQRSLCLMQEPLRQTEGHNINPVHGRSLPYLALMSTSGKGLLPEQRTYNTSIAESICTSIYY